MAKLLKKVAEENARVTYGSNKEQEVIKEGVPNDHHRKQCVTNAPIVGVNVGTTLNMGDYQSLRVDVWLSDNVSENETFAQAYERVVGEVDKVLNELVDSYSK